MMRAPESEVAHMVGGACYVQGSALQKSVLSSLRAR